MKSNLDGLVTDQNVKSSKKKKKKKISFIGKSFHDLKLGQDLTSCKKTLTTHTKKEQKHNRKNPPENSDYSEIKNFLLKE